MTKQILEEKVESSTTLSPEAIAKLGWNLTDAATVEKRYVHQKVLDTSLQPSPYGSGESLYVVTTTDRADIAHVCGYYAAQGLNMADFSTMEIDEQTHVLEINESDLMMAERRRDTVDELWLGEDGPDDEEPEGHAIRVLSTNTTRSDYSPEAAKALTDCKRGSHGRVLIDQYTDGEEYYDLYETTRLPKVPEADIRYVNYGDTAHWWATDRIRDDEGPLPGSNWRVVVHAGDDYGAGYKSAMWTSDQIVPTGVNLVEKVQRYLDQTGDFHTFLEDIRIDHVWRTLNVALGS